MARDTVILEVERDETGTRGDPSTPAVRGPTLTVIFAYAHSGTVTALAVAPERNGENNVAITTIAKRGRNVRVVVPS